MDFTEKIPPGFIDAVTNNKASISRQILFSAEEKICFPQELEDPIGDHRHEVLPGVVHRYPDRLLILLTQSCAGHCRFCFRKALVSQSSVEHNYQQSSAEHNYQQPSAEHNYQQSSAEHSCADIETIRNYIIQNPKIREVILSGGEPLLVTDDMLQTTLQTLGQIESIKILRIHTRATSTIPQRITPHLAHLLGNSPKPLWIVIHINHVDELTPATKDAILRLQNVGIPILSQTVLLAGVNDSFQALATLFQTLLEYRIKPYYLHYPDLAPGTSHFRISLSRALALVRSLRGAISGIAIPDFVVDIPGGYGKIVLAPELAHCINEHTWQFQSPLTNEIITVQYPCINESVGQ